MKFEHKHRPHSLADIIFADAHVAGVIQETASGVRDNHIILHGPRGSGKSETARLLQQARLGSKAQGVFADPIHAKTYEHESFDPILTTWNWQIMAGAPMGCVVIDEIDQFSTAMQQKLRAFVDRYSMGIIVCTTNNLHAVDQPLQDRCRCLKITYPTIEQWVPRAQEILAREGIELTQQQTRNLLNGFENSGRKMMDWLEDRVIEIRQEQRSFRKQLGEVSYD
jgi:replication-associated recombination protein RarA